MSRIITHQHLSRRAVLRGLEALCLGQMESLRRTAERIAEGRP